MRWLPIAVVAMAAAIFGFVTGAVVTVELFASTTDGSSSADVFSTESLGREWAILVGGTVGGLIAATWSVLLVRRYSSS